jgi:hypothetical protein
MVGIAEEPPRQLAPLVGNAATRFRYPGGIHRQQQLVGCFIIINNIGCLADLFDQNCLSHFEWHRRRPRKFNLYTSRRRSLRSWDHCWCSLQGLSRLAFLRNECSKKSSIIDRAESSAKYSYLLIDQERKQRNSSEGSNPKKQKILHVIQSERDTRRKRKDKHRLILVHMIRLSRNR